ncbi:hypothetical protein P3S67_022501 [Capsicum chacoense]
MLRCTTTGDQPAASSRLLHFSFQPLVKPNSGGVAKPTLLHPVRSSHRLPSLSETFEYMMNLRSPSWDTMKHIMGFQHFSKC